MRLILIGASGHGKVCVEIARLLGYDEILLLDENREKKECGGYPIVGVEDDFEKFVDNATFFFVSIGNMQIRKRIQERIKIAGGKIATLIHPKGIISKDVKIGIGSVVMAGAVINPGTILHEGVIVNTSSSIDHDCVIGLYSHIAVGSHICGSVHIGNNTWIGAGTTVSNNLSICDDCMIGAGALVVQDITIAGTYVGVPVQKRDSTKENVSI